ncbi:MAG: hypothetical protein O2826_06305 [Chloroflexi bacterium]|nr:hypothetical protein [Chloroflexota bacterium]MDA1174113.1 hypothetical protein [Chloroflexota bacterium]
MDYTGVQRRVLLNTADLLLLRESFSAKLRKKASTPAFWRQADFNQRVEELIGEQAQLCEREHLHREFALLVAGWPQAQEHRQSWTAELLVDAAANALVGIVAKRA